MCGFVRPAKPLADTLNTTCRNRYAIYNELGEDEDDTEIGEVVSDGPDAAEPFDATSSGLCLL